MLLKSIGFFKISLVKLLTNGNESSSMQVVTYINESEEKKMSYTFEQLTIGQEAKNARTVTETDVVLYGGISGDLNPAHFNEVESSKGMFKGRIVHGMLTAGYISAALGMQLPGPGTIYLKQSLKFTAPVRFGDTITTTVTVTELDEKRKRATLKTVCSNQNGDLVLKGEAVVIPPAK